VLHSLSTVELVQLLANGADLEFDASGRPTLDLVQIAANAARYGRHVVLIGCANRPTTELIQIASNGKGFVRLKDE
jgi:hypothetical protein